MSILTFGISGTGQSTDTEETSTTGAQVTHTYTVPGYKTATLTINDGSDNPPSDTLTVTVFELVVDSDNTDDELVLPGRHGKPELKVMKRKNAPQWGGHTETTTTTPTRTDSRSHSCLLMLLRRQAFTSTSIRAIRSLHRQIGLNEYMM